MTYSPCGAPLEDVKVYTLQPGVHKVTAEAEDAAGHQGSAEHSYSVVATFNSLSALTGISRLKPAHRVGKAVARLSSSWKLPKREQPQEKVRKPANCCKLTSRK